MFDTLKGALQSWTVRTNVASLALLPALDHAQEVLPTLQAFLPTHLYGTAFTILAIANILLRFKTMDSLSDKAQ